MLSCHTRRLSVSLLLTSFLLALVAAEMPVARLHGQTPTGWELLGRGVNYGNMLEAPTEGEWGLRFDDRWPEQIRQAGFDTVRLPVRWSTHADPNPPYRIDPAFLERVQSIIDRNLQQNLRVVVNLHHYEELFADPQGHRERFLAIWKQLSEAFQSAPANLYLEPLNEPHDKLQGELWNELLVEVLSVIRPKHPDRWVVAGPDFWSNVSALPRLKFPEKDRRLIVTVHYYLPFAFTHQGAPWNQPILPTGLNWDGTAEQQKAMDDDFKLVIDWATKADRPVYIGEFGAYEKAPLESRARWTQAVRERCEKHQMGWSYWELASGFGILDPATLKWREPLLHALLPPAQRDGR
jgi:endoglucanase